MHSWNGVNMIDRIQPHELLASYQVALQVVSSELRWKIYYVATQMLLRALVHIRLSVFSDVRCFLYLPTALLIDLPNGGVSAFIPSSFSTCLFQPI